MALCLLNKDIMTLLVTWWQHLFPIFIPMTLRKKKRKRKEWILHVYYTIGCLIGKVYRTLFLKTIDKKIQSHTENSKLQTGPKFL